MEEKIYDRQVTKQSLAARVVDEQQIERHFTMNELAELYEFMDEPLSAKPTPMVPEDRLLAELVDKHKEMIWKLHCHESLLENKVTFFHIFNRPVSNITDYCLSVWRYFSKIFKFYMYFM